MLLLLRVPGYLQHLQQRFLNQDMPQHGEGYHPYSRPPEGRQQRGANQDTTADGLPQHGEGYHPHSRPPG